MKYSKQFLRDDLRKFSGWKWSFYESGLYFFSKEEYYIACTESQINSGEYFTMMGCGKSEPYASVISKMQKYFK